VDKARAFDERHGEVLALEREIGERRAQAEREAEARRVAEAEAQRVAEAEARREAEARQRTEAPLPPSRQPVAPSHTPESRRRLRRSLGVVGLIVLVSAAIAWFLFPRPSPPVPPPSPPGFQVGPGQSTAPDAGAVPQGKAATQTDPGDLTYLWIPPGTFEMGCSPGDNECSGGEKPAHRVTITKGFWMGRTEVTVAAYKRFTAATGRAMPEQPAFNSSWRLDDHPVVIVTWDDAAAYCRWAGGRLPTEAEWEYAARGGTTEARYGPLDELAWYESNSGGKAHAVGQKRANAFGLYDMLGNLWEWVGDRYAENYYGQSPSQDPQGPSSGSYRVLRGGSWVDYPNLTRVSVRIILLPGYRLDNYGFRCVREVIR
jgi:formylglycine-generating enzyme required for sulfatase activity